MNSSVDGGKVAFLTLAVCVWANSIGLAQQYQYGNPLSSRTNTTFSAWENQEPAANPNPIFKPKESAGLSPLLVPVETQDPVAKTPDAAKPDAAEKTEPKKDEVIKTGPGKPEPPKYPDFKVTGFFQVDSGYFHQDTVNRATLGDIEDGTGFRRARIAAKGNVAENTSYLMEFDFAQAQARFVDVWMQFDKTPAGNIRIGRFRQPFGMTELTSVRELPFLERSSMFALSPFRQTGIMASDAMLDDRGTWAVSGYRYLSDNFGNVFGDSGGYGMASRLTWLPFDCGDESLVHVGLDYSFNDPARNLVQFASQDEFFLGQNPNLGPNGLSVLPIIFVPPFVNTGLIPTSQSNLFNVEAAWSMGRALVQSEARWAQVTDTSGVTNTFPAVYIQARYMLTGEIIPYNRKQGVFGRVKPHCPVNLAMGQFGAWELTGRISNIDLNGVGLPGPGRRLTDYTTGLNWYVNDFTKFQFNWIHANLDDPTLGSSDANTFAFRAQLDF